MAWHCHQFNLWKHSWKKLKPNWQGWSWKLTSASASPARSASYKRDSSALGSTSKRRAKARATPSQASGQPKLARVFHGLRPMMSRMIMLHTHCLDENPLTTVKELVQVSGPIRSEVLPARQWRSGFSNFPQKREFAKMFQDAAVPKAKLQEAAIQHGLPMEQSLKLIAIATALIAWLAMSWQEWLPLFWSL